MRILTLLFLLLLAGCYQDKPHDYLNSDQVAAIWRGQEDQAVMKFCSNNVPGKIRAFVQTSIQDDGNAVIKWRARTEFDYVDGSGGIQRTNMLLLFACDSQDRLYCQMQ